MNMRRASIYIHTESCVYLKVTNNLWKHKELKRMRIPVLIFLLFFFELSIAQGPGDFHIFLGFEKYELGSNRSSADTNIYLQTDGVIKENGRVKHVYHYKDLNLVPYRFINGVDFQTLLLFYESEKLVRIELARAYVEGTEKRKDSLRGEDLKKLYSFISQLCGKKVRKKIIENNDFIIEKGYQWKKEDKIMQVKTYNLKRRPTNMLIISIKYKGQ